MPNSDWKRNATKKRRNKRRRHTRQSLSIDCCFFVTQTVSLSYREAEKGREGGRARRSRTANISDDRCPTGRTRRGYLVVGLLMPSQAPLDDDARSQLLTQRINTRIGVTNRSRRASTLPQHQASKANSQHQPHHLASCFIHRYTAASSIH